MHIFNGFSSNVNYYHTEYRWIEEGKFQEDIFTLIEDKINDARNNSIKLKKNKEERIKNILSQY